LVRRKRTGSAWEREIVALVRAHALEGDARAAGLLEYTICITKPVLEPICWKEFQGNLVERVEVSLSKCI